MRKLCLPLLLAFVLLLPSWVGAEPRPIDRQLQERVATLLSGAAKREQLDHFAGKPADRCIGSSEGMELCQWNLGDRNAGWNALASAIDTSARVALVCELPTSGAARALTSCNAFPMRTNREQFYLKSRGSGGKRAMGAGDLKRKRAEYQRIAASWIGNARTVVEMSMLMGAIPDRCALVATKEPAQTCRWKASSRTYGQGTLAAWIESSARKRIRLDCVFPLSGAALEHTCSAEVGS